MKIGFINPFISAAQDVLAQEVGTEVSRGTPHLESAKTTTGDVTVIVGVTGDARGIVMYSLSEITAKCIAGAMLKESVPVMDQLAESAIAELGNVIAGAATVNLEKEGYICTLTPPTIIYGRGTIISLIDINRLVVPMSTNYGSMDICIALRGTGA